MTLLENIIVGGFAGVISRTITAPIDLYKIQLQNPYMPAKSLYDVTRMEGVRHLWKGNLSNCIRVFPQQAISYFVYQRTHHTLSTQTLQNLQTLQNQTTKTFLSSFTGGSVATLLTYPLETMRSRFSLQVNQSHYRSLSHALRTTPIHHWYQGVGICMAGFPVFNALSFTVFHKLPPINHEMDRVIRGGLAGMVAVTVTYPTDLIRRRMQMQGFDASVPSYSSTRHAIKQILRDQGIRGLYRGLGVCYLKLFPASGIQFYCYQWLHELFSTKSINPYTHKRTKSQSKR